MGWFQGRDNTFGPTEKLEGFQGFPITCGHIGGAAGILVVTMLGSYSRIVQAGRDAVSSQNLPVIVLENVRFCPVQNPYRAGN